MKKVLVPEAGWEVWTDFIKYFADHTDICLVAVDAQSGIPAEYMADLFYHIPYYDEDWAKEALIEIIVEEEIDCIAPTFEHWLVIWEEIVADYQVECIVDIETAKFFKDKYAVFKRCKQHAIPTIPTWQLASVDPVTSVASAGSAEELVEWSGSSEFRQRPGSEREFPTERYVKPRFWSGSKKNFQGKGMECLHSLTHYLSYDEDEYIIQPMTEWTHWSVDVVSLWNSTMIIPKVGNVVQWSKIIAVSIERDSKVIAAVRRIMKHIGVDGIYNIECIQQGDEILLMEVNVRLAWWTIYSVEWWFNLYEYVLSTKKTFKQYCIAKFHEIASKERFQPKKVLYKYGVTHDHLITSGVKWLVVKTSSRWLENSSETKSASWTTSWWVSWSRVSWSRVPWWAPWLTTWWASWWTPWWTPWWVPKSTLWEDSFWSPQVLLVKRNDVPYWTLPGWHIDRGESAKQALIRELDEELEWNLAYRNLEFYTNIIQYGIKTRKYALYTLEYEDWLYDTSCDYCDDNYLDETSIDKDASGKDARGVVISNDEVADWWFFAWDDLPDFVDHATRDLIETYCKEYVQRKTDRLPYSLARYGNRYGLRYGSRYGADRAVYINYWQEVQTLLKKPISWLYLLSKLARNQLFSWSFKL